MKHEKEWYTCDRCGVEINEDLKPWMKPLEAIRKRMDNSTYLTMISSMARGYLSSAERESPDIMACTLVEYYSKEEREIHLCGEFRKEFERFMKNE